MTIPQAHQQQLDSELEGHDRRLKTLDRLLQNMRDEAAIHREVVRLGRDQRLLAVIGALYDDPDLLDAVRRDWQRVARERSVELPSGAQVTVTGVEDDRRVELKFRTGRSGYALTWNRLAGFEGAIVRIEEGES